MGPGVALRSTPGLALSRLRRSCKRSPRSGVEEPVVAELLLSAKGRTTFRSIRNPTGSCRLHGFHRLWKPRSLGINCGVEAGPKQKGGPVLFQAPKERNV